MANAANSPFVKHPALLALFAPRPAPPFKPPMPSKPMGKLSGIAQFTTEFMKEPDEPPPNKFETPTERKIRLKKEKREKHETILTDRESEWDPHNNPKATKDPYKTLFVARLSYELTEDDLRREFERYGRIREVKLISDKNTGKSRGYAFIEFERSNDLKEAFQHADGHKLKGRRILVDVERGRTVKTWKPRKLGGGLGKTRAGPKDDKSNHSGSRHSSSRHKSSRDRMHSNRSAKKDGKYSSRRDKYRDRDFRDRDRRSSRTDRDRKDTSSRNDRDRAKKRSRSRDRGKDRKRDRDRVKKEDKDRDRSKTDRGDRNRTDKVDRSGRNDRNDRGRSDRNNNNNNNVKYENDRMNGRKDRDNKDDRDRTSSRRRRSRSKDKNRDRRR